MRLTTDYSPIEDRVQRGHDRAVRGVLDDHRQQAPSLSGEYAASLQARGSGLTARIGSPLPQARALRQGANVGSRQGPHHGPVDTFNDGQAYVERMPRELRSA